MCYSIVILTSYGSIVPMITSEPDHPVQTNLADFTISKSRRTKSSFGGMPKHSRSKDLISLVYARSAPSKLQLSFWFIEKVNSREQFSVIRCRSYHQNLVPRYEMADPCVRRSASEDLERLKAGHCCPHSWIRNTELA